MEARAQTLKLDVLLISMRDMVSTRTAALSLGS